MAGWQAPVWMLPALLLGCAALWPTAWPVRDPARPSEQTALEEAERWHEAAAGYVLLAEEQPALAKVWRAEARRCLWQHRLTQITRSPLWHRCISSTTLPQAAEQLSEVLELVQTYGVDSPSAEYLFQLALRDLKLALENPSFRRLAFPSGLSPTERIALRAELIVLQSADQHRPRSKVVQDAQRLASRWQLRHNAQPTAIFTVLWRAAAALDDYSDYLLPPWYELESRSGVDIEGSTGLTLLQEGESLVVQQVLPGSPADKAGLSANDVITRIDAQPASSLRLEEAEQMLLGPLGSKVLLQWQTGIPRRPRQAELTRVELPLSSVVEAHLPDANGSIGYLRLLHFEEKTPKELDRALAQLGAARLKVLIVDLRGNPGGLLTAAAAVAGRWLPPATVAFSTTGSCFATDYLTKGPGQRCPKLVIMVDRNTASSAEALAAALSRDGRAVLIGETTYGKARVQHLLPLKRAGGGLRLSTCRWHLPDLPPTDSVSIQPAVPFTEGGLTRSELSPEAEARSQFEAALELARSLAADPVAPWARN